LLGGAILETRCPSIGNLQAQFLKGIPRLSLSFRIHWRSLRFSTALETATHRKMSLQPPKRTAAGFYLALQIPVTSPRTTWTAEGRWVAPARDASGAEWHTWAESQRATLLGEMLSHGNWFSRPPRREILDPLFTPWIARTMPGEMVFACKLPDVPGPVGVGGTAIWQLEGLLMSSTAIDPVWTLQDVCPQEDLDQISLFGDIETVDGDDDSGDETLFKRVSVGPVTAADTPAIAAAFTEETREIQLDEIAEAPDAKPFRIRSREWETRKFLAKERVREARLKAQIAQRMADKEETRFYTQFGELDDKESRFSDYDLSDGERDDGDDGFGLEDADEWEAPPPRQGASTIQHV
jgi:hypothetical protein